MPGMERTMQWMITLFVVGALGLICGLISYNVSNFGELIEHQIFDKPLSKIITIMWFVMSINAFVIAFILKSIRKDVYEDLDLLEKRLKSKQDKS